jgi:hypothetical protein
VDHGLGEGQFALGAAEEVVGVLGGVGEHQGHGVGQADVLDGHAHEAAGQNSGSSPPTSIRASQ